jgi:hypothetical protein
MTLTLRAAPYSVSRRSPSAASFCCSSQVPLLSAFTRMVAHPRVAAASTHLWWFSTAAWRPAESGLPSAPSASIMIRCWYTP